MLEDEEFIQDGKCRNYVAAMEKALKNFEYSSDWPDLINALTKLSKVINAHAGKYKVIPRRLLLTKRLSQCLHPTLPSGVHLKALEAYDLVFKSIGTEKLRADLFIYATGLFPLLNYAGITVKPPLLKIYETYLLPLGEDLLPCLDGFLTSILLGMEESADNSRSSALLDSIKIAVPPPVFYTVLWKSILHVPRVRQAAINYLLTQRESILGNDLLLLQTAIKTCLTDTNILVQRLSLELLSARNLVKKDVDLVKTGLKTLLRRDPSLNRRLFSWLEDCDGNLLLAIQSLLNDNDEDNFRILVYLFDKQRPGSDSLQTKILVDVVRSMYIHNTSPLVGSIFFSTLNSHFVWHHLFTLLDSCLLSEISASVQRPGSGNAPVSELSLLIAFLTEKEYLDRTELESFHLQLLERIQLNLDGIPLSNLIPLFHLLKIIRPPFGRTITVRIYCKFVSSLLFGSFGVTETFQKLVLSKKDPDKFYGLDFEANVVDSLREMREKDELVAPVLKFNSNSYLVDAYKMLNELLLCEFRSIGVELEDAETELVLQSLAIVTLSSCHEIGMSAIGTLIVLLHSSHSSRHLLESTITIEHIGSVLWEGGDLDQLAAFINWYPVRIQKLFMRATCSATLNLEESLVKVKKLLEKNVQMDGLVCKILDGLESVDGCVRGRSEVFVYEYFGKDIGKILLPVIRILEVQLKLTTSVLSGSCHELAHRESESAVDAFAKDSTNDKTQPQSSLIMDAKGRLTFPSVSHDSTESNEVEVLDEDDYFRLLESTSSCSDKSVADINHNETKQGVNGDSSVTCLSGTTLDSDNKFTMEMHRLASENESEMPSAMVTTHRLFSIHPYTTEMMLYTFPPDIGQMMYAFHLLKTIMETDAESFLITLATSTNQQTGQCYLEVVIGTLLRILQSFLIERDNRLLTLHLEAVRILRKILSGFVGSQYREIMSAVLGQVHLPRVVLYLLVTLPMLEAEENLTSTEEIIKHNYENIYLVYKELNILSTTLISFESELKHFKLKTKVKYHHSSGNSYSVNVPFFRQPLLLDSFKEVLKDEKLSAFHLIILESIIKSLAFYKGEKFLHDIVNLLIRILANTQAIGTRLVYIGKILESMTSIFHFVLLEESIENEKVEAATGLFSNLVSAFVGGSSLTSSSQTHKGKRTFLKMQFLSFLPSIIPSLVRIYSSHAKPVWNLLKPLAVAFSSEFLEALGRAVPTPTADFVYGMQLFPMNSLITGIDSFLKGIADNPPIATIGISPDGSLSVALNLLSLLSELLEKKCRDMAEVSNGLISLLRSTLPLPVQIQLLGIEIFLKLVKGMGGGKESIKDFQELGGKLLEAALNSCGEKKIKSELVCSETLDCLNEHLIGVVDLVWQTSDEKLPMNNIINFLLNFLRSKFPLENYCQSVALLAKLSQYPHLKKGWKKEVFELLLESSFFHFPSECLKDWMVVLDNLFTDKATFGEFLARVSVPQTGSLNIFSSKDVEYELRGMLLKRLAFVIYSSPRDQYSRFMTVIQERMAEAIKMPSLVPIIQSQVFLCFRVLLLRLSPQHLNSLWPIIIHEALQTLIQMETDLLTQQESHLHLYLHLSKLLQVALNLSQLPHFQQSNIFQMYRWTFVGPASPSFTPHLRRIASLMHPSQDASKEFRLSKTKRIDAIEELYPFLMDPDKGLNSNLLEDGVGIDFIE